MMTQKQIDASIEALQPAPAGETLHQVGVRAVHWLLGTIEDEHAEIAVTRGLYAKAIAGDMPTEAEWRKNIDALYRARDLAIEEGGAHPARQPMLRVLALARALGFAIARDLNFALALDLDLALAIDKLLGERLVPIERLDAAILAAIDDHKGTLDMRDWHRCETTHCRAGWAITLHPMGKELEATFGPWLAGAVIYLRSTGSVPNFYASNEEAMADIKACASESNRKGRSKSHIGDQK